MSMNRDTWVGLSVFCGALASGVLATLFLPTSVSGAVGAVSSSAKASTSSTSGAYKLGDRLAQPVAPASGPRLIKWDDLYPKNWDPYASVKGLDFSRLNDGDPRAMAAMERIKESLKDAPVMFELNNVTVRIAGFMIPIDKLKDDTRSFLLVPYFGACIHTPPPPLNQIIDVRAETLVKGARTMDPVWVTGKMQVVRSDSPFGAVGYRLDAQLVEPYDFEKEKGAAKQGEKR